MTAQINADVGGNTGCDHAAVREALEKYVYALDRRDASRLVDCFTDGAQISHHGGQTHYVGGREFASSALTALGQFAGMNHAISSVGIAISGDSAEADYYVIATLVKSSEPVAIIRGVHFSETLVRTRSGWRVDRREHTPKWQFELPTTRIEFPAPSS